jgi:hypothetical protein
LQVLELAMAPEPIRGQTKGQPGYRLNPKIDRMDCWVSVDLQYGGTVLRQRFYLGPAMRLLFIHQGFARNATSRAVIRQHTRMLRKL